MDCLHLNRILEDISGRLQKADCDECQAKDEDFPDGWKAFWNRIERDDRKMRSETKG